MRHWFRNKGTLAGLSLAGAFLLANTALATPTLQLTESGADRTFGTADDTQQTITDNTGIDTGSRDGLININTTIGVFDINFDTAITKPQQGDASDPQMEITYRHGSDAAGDLRVEFSETDFNLTGNIQFFSSNSGETDQGGSVQFQVYVDDSNTLFGQGANVGDTGPISVNSGFTERVDGVASLSGDFSLTQVLTFRNDRAGSASGDTETEIPAPATLGLLGAGLIGLGVLSRRRNGAEAIA